MSDALYCKEHQRLYSPLPGKQQSKKEVGKWGAVVEVGKEHLVANIWEAPPTYPSAEKAMEAAAQLAMNDLADNQWFLRQGSTSRRSPPPWHIEGSTCVQGPVAIPQVKLWAEGGSADSSTSWPADSFTRLILDANVPLVLLADFVAQRYMAQVHYACYKNSDDDCESPH